MAEKTVIMTIRIPESLKKILEDRAKLAKMSLNRYLVEEVFLATNLQFYYCPKCKRPVADMRYMDNYRYIGLTCPWCGHEWEVENDEEF